MRQGKKRTPSGENSVTRYNIWNLPRKVVGSNDENSTPQPIDCPGRAASMSRSLRLNGRSSRRRSSSSRSRGRYIVFAALQHLLTFYFAFVFFALRQVLLQVQSN